MFGVMDSLSFDSYHHLDETSKQYVCRYFVCVENDIDTQFTKKEEIKSVSASSYQAEIWLVNIFKKSKNTTRILQSTYIIWKQETRFQPVQEENRRLPPPPLVTRKWANHGSKKNIWNQVEVARIQTEITKTYRLHIIMSLTNTFWQKKKQY